LKTFYEVMRMENGVGVRSQEFGVRSLELEFGITLINSEEIETQQNFVGWLD